MEKVPEIVRERLRAASVAADHPDADLLTAFSERTLSATERTLVLQHLANCLECRDVVALALPESESNQQVARPSKSEWLTWPVLRWGVVAAGVILVGSFGLIEYKQQHDARTNQAAGPTQSVATEAKNGATPLPGPVAKLKTSQNIPSKQAQPTPMGMADGAPKPDVGAPSTATLVRVNPPTANLQHGPHVQSQQNAIFQNPAGSGASPTPPARVLVARPAENVPVPAQSEAVEVASAPTAAKNETANLDAQVARLEAPSGVQPLESRVERSKPATPSMAVGGPQAASVEAQKVGATSGRGSAGLVAASLSAPVIWNVTSGGTLQRSFDQGTSWQDVDFESRSESSRASMRVAAKQSASDALKKDAQNPSFRAVASNGPDVWAGAAGGFLYHSIDAGAHWLRVVPSFSGTSLSGDIVSLEFPDPQHGRVVTSAPEVWSTSDGGQTWLKQ